MLAAPADAVDLLIRTGGERRLRDFMLWELAHAELHFTDCPWPDFDADRFQCALDDYASRKDALATSRSRSARTPSRSERGGGPQLVSVANLARRDGLDFLHLVPQIGIVTQTTRYPLNEANKALADLHAGRFEGAAVVVP